MLPVSPSSFFPPLLLIQFLTKVGEFRYWLVLGIRYMCILHSGKILERRKKKKKSEPIRSNRWIKIACRWKPMTSDGKEISRLNAFREGGSGPIMRSISRHMAAGVVFNCQRYISLWWCVYTCGTLGRTLIRAHRDFILLYFCFHRVWHGDSVLSPRLYSHVTLAFQAEIGFLLGQETRRLPRE